MNSSDFFQSDLKSRLETIKHNIRATRIPDAKVPSLLGFIRKGELGQRSSNQITIKYEVEQNQHGQCHYSRKRENRDAIESMFKKARFHPVQKQKQQSNPKRGLKRNYSTLSMVKTKQTVEYEVGLGQLQAQFQQFKEERLALIQELGHKDHEIRCLRNELAKWQEEL